MTIDQYAGAGSAGHSTYCYAELHTLCMVHVI